VANCDFAHAVCADALRKQIRTRLREGNIDAGSMDGKPSVGNSPLQPGPVFCDTPTGGEERGIDALDMNAPLLDCLDRVGDLYQFASGGFRICVGSIVGEFHAALLRFDVHLLWLEAASPCKRIVTLSEHVLLNDKYRPPSGQAAYNDERAYNCYNLAFRKIKHFARPGRGSGRSKALHRRRADRRDGTRTVVDNRIAGRHQASGRR
jgi:hypothetical protein